MDPHGRFKLGAILWLHPPESKDCICPSEGAVWERQSLIAPQGLSEWYRGLGLFNAGPQFNIPMTTPVYQSPGKGQGPLMYLGSLMCPNKFIQNGVSLFKVCQGYADVGHSRSPVLSLHPLESAHK